MLTLRVICGVACQAGVHSRKQPCRGRLIRNSLDGTVYELSDFFSFSVHTYYDKILNNNLEILGTYLSFLCFTKFGNRISPRQYKPEEEQR